MKNFKFAAGDQNKLKDAMIQQIKIKNNNNEIIKAGCVVMNDKKEVLLVTDKTRKIWSFPKGHAESGETLEQVALREVREETGYEVEIMKRLTDIIYAHGETGELIRVAMFLAKPIKITGSPEKETYSEWFPIEEAKKIIYPNLIYLLDE